MKSLHWTILGIMFMLATWSIYRTRETPLRNDSNIDLNWRFSRDDPAGADKPEYDDSDWKYLSVPHDWVTEQSVSRTRATRNPTNPSGKPINPSAHSANLSGRIAGSDQGAVGWYRRTLDLSSYREQKKFYILFEGIQRNSEIYFNGKYLGKQAYGYVSFYHDITPLIRRDTLNVIAVRTDCSSLSADCLNGGGGIYRHVKLIAKHAVHIPIWGTAVSSDRDNEGHADISISMDIQNSGKRTEGFEVKFDIVDPEGRTVVTDKSAEVLSPESRTSISRVFHIEHPELWSPASPDLYSVHCYLMDKNRQIDHVGTMHGIRSAIFDPDKGFLLNGKQFVLNGVYITREDGETGATLPVETWKNILHLLKEQGVNAIRLVHHPHAPEVLDLCDRMGFLVIDEIFDPKLADSRSPDLSNFILRDRNHASVILWSLGQESMGQLHKRSKEGTLFQDLKELVITLDPTRKVSIASYPGNLSPGYGIPPGLRHMKAFDAGQFNRMGKDQPGELAMKSDRNEVKPAKRTVLNKGNVADSTARAVRKGKQLLILQAGSEPGDLIIRTGEKGL